MRRTAKIVVLLAFAVVVSGAQAGEARSRTDWFHDARWGVFIHYLAKSDDVSVDEWNRVIDGFDAEGLAQQLESARAGYLILTLGQNSGHYLSPNATYDALTGIRPSKCSRRDLVDDLYRVLAPRGIRLMVYLPGGAPDRDKVAMEKLEWKTGPHRNLEFQRKWERVIAEWSERWGRKVSGWWFDGCYWPNAMYRSMNPPNFASFAGAARKGNADSIVAFNRGVIFPIISMTEQEDYTAGEMDDPSKVQVSEFWLDGAQFHMLSYLGKAWSAGPPRFTTDQVVEFTSRITRKGGVVSWDVPTDARGLILEPFLEQLRAIGAVVR
ncbi:MAG TPA: alpha-L-fucosidase [Bryobacteraceae bacterium]|nr:alpha-L-fucosidase [Bryobacteraceae bacterium]